MKYAGSRITICKLGQFNKSTDKIIIIPIKREFSFYKPSPDGQIEIFSGGRSTVTSGGLSVAFRQSYFTSCLLSVRLIRITGYCYTSVGITRSFLDNSDSRK